jgi:hypothetical protein
MNKWSLGIGALIAAVGTRFMEDGNLLVTSVCVLLSALITYSLWRISRRIYLLLFR